MKLSTPRWWYVKSGAPSPVTRALLTPLSWIWAAATARRIAKGPGSEIGAAVICVTHDPRLEAYADRVIHIEDGRILDDVRRTPDANPGPLSH